MKKQFLVTVIKSVENRVAQLLVKSIKHTNGKHEKMAAKIENLNYFLNVINKKKYKTDKCIKIKVTKFCINEKNCKEIH